MVGVMDGIQLSWMSVNVSSFEPKSAFTAMDSEGRKCLQSAPDETRAKRS